MTARAPSEGSRKVGAKWLHWPQLGPNHHQVGSSSHQRVQDITSGGSRIVQRMCLRGSGVQSGAHSLTYIDVTRQRAFRIRKEQHVKDLEDKVVALEATQEKLSAENVRLQEDLNKATVENTILRSLTTPGGPRENGTSTSSQCGLDGEAERLAFMNTPAIPSFDSRHFTSATAQCNVRGGVLKGSKIWEFIIGHPLFQEGLIDVNMVAQQLLKYPHRDNGGCIAEGVLIECIEKSVKT